MSQSNSMWGSVNWKSTFYAAFLANMIKAVLYVAMGKNPLFNGSQLMPDASATVQNLAGFVVFMFAGLCVYGPMYAVFFGQAHKPWDRFSKGLMAGLAQAYSSIVLMPWSPAVDWVNSLKYLVIYFGFCLAMSYFYKPKE